MTSTIQQIIEKLRPIDPEKIIMFGSHASGIAHRSSDIDLLIIKKTNKRPVDRIRDVLPFVWGSVPHIEPQVFTPQEMEDAVKQNRYFLTQEVLKHGMVIYEKK